MAQKKREDDLTEVAPTAWGDLMGYKEYRDREKLNRHRNITVSDDNQPPADSHATPED